MGRTATIYHSGMLFWAALIGAIVVAGEVLGFADGEERCKRDLILGFTNCRPALCGILRDAAPPVLEPVPCYILNLAPFTLIIPAFIIVRAIQDTFGLRQRPQPGSSNERRRARRERIRQERIRQA